MSQSPPSVETPSFEPYVGRVRTTRAVAAVGAFVLTGSLCYAGGMPLEDAALRAMIVTVLAYFLAWGGALWLCSELYFVQVERLRARLQEAEQRRADQLQDLYIKRLEGTEGSDDGSAGVATTPMSAPMGQRPAA
jgi:hypothetical protein